MDRKLLQETVEAFDDDRQYRDLATAYGLRELACILDGLNRDNPHVLSDFSAGNHFAHLLFRGHDPNEAL